MAVEKSSEGRLLQAQLLISSNLGSHVIGDLTLITTIYETHPVLVILHFLHPVSKFKVSNFMAVTHMPCAR